MIIDYAFATLVILVAGKRFYDLRVERRGQEKAACAVGVKRVEPRVGNLAQLRDDGPKSVVAHQGGRREPTLTPRKKNLEPQTIVIATDPILGDSQITSMVRGWRRHDHGLIVPVDTDGYDTYETQPYEPEPVDAISLAEATAIMNEIDNREANG